MPASVGIKYIAQFPGRGSNRLKWRKIAIALIDPGRVSFERYRMVSSVTMRKKYWLIEIAVRWRQPSNVDESCLF
jgi:hypothetical protein